jgi:hypothetical protein
VALGAVLDRREVNVTSTGQSESDFDAGDEQRQSEPPRRIPAPIMRGQALNEELLSRLRNRLQRKKERLEQTVGGFFKPKLCRFWAFLNSEPFLAQILAELRGNGKGKSAAENANSRTGPNSQYDPRVRESIDALATDEEVAAMAYYLLEGICEKGWKFEEINMYVWGSHPGNMNEYNTFKPEVIVPFCEYLDERLDEQQSILGLLVRYKHRCEWFNKRALLETAKDEQAATGDEKKRAEVEKVLKEDLYRYLHDQGMEFTIEPKSDKGEIDLIADQAEGDRKYLEGKVFDNAGRNKGYIVKGFGQLLHYLRQYNAASGYLLIYKTCEQQLVIDGTEHLGTVPFVRCEGKTVFILVLDICEYEKPVSQRTYQPVRVTTDELRKADQTS